MAALDEAVAFYDRVADLIDGRVRRAKGATELNLALRDLLASARVGVDPDGRYAVGVNATRGTPGQIVAEFVLRDSPSFRLWAALPPGGDRPTKRLTDDSNLDSRPSYTGSSLGS